MRYRVAFTRRVQSDGADPMRPSAELDLNLSDGIVAEKVFVEQLQSEAQHSQEELDEDDAFLGSAAPEIWEYEIVDARAAALGEGGVYPPDGGNDTVDVTAVPGSRDNKI
jgi:hypothetical protein